MQRDLDKQPLDEHDNCKHITAQKLLGSELWQCADCGQLLKLLVHSEANQKGGRVEIGLSATLMFMCVLVIVVVPCFLSDDTARELAAGTVLFCLALAFLFIVGVALGQFWKAWRKT